MDDTIAVSVNKKHLRDYASAFKDVLYDKEERPRAAKMLLASAAAAAAATYAMKHVPPDATVLNRLRASHIVDNTLGAWPAYGILGGSLYAYANRDDKDRAARGIGVALGSLGAVGHSLALDKTMTAGQKLKDLAIISSAAAPAAALYAGHLANDRALDKAKRDILASDAPPEAQAYMLAQLNRSSFDTKYPEARHLSVPQPVKDVHDKGPVTFIRERLYNAL